MSMPKKRPVDYLLKPMHQFLENEMATGILLLFMVVVAMVWANSPWSATYHHLWETHFTIGTRDINLDKTLHHWINDGLMAIFFFLVGLEIKKEIINGELSSWKKASLPIAAALGGMILPAGLYVLFNAGTPGVDGWGIPMATDIAFTLGLVALISSKVPTSLKIFLTALAIVDDIGAVLVIAIFYTPDIQLMQLVYAACFLGLMYGCNLLGVRNFWVYFMIGVPGLWTSILYSGVHATVAGVIAAFAIPSRVSIQRNEYADKLKKWAEEFSNADEQGPFLSSRKMHIIADIERESEAAQTPLQRFEHELSPLVSYFVIPLFALANAGVTIEGNIFNMITHPVSLGIIAGLFIGKLVGILVFSKVMTTIGASSLPGGANWHSVGGVAMMAGIGFTMSLFIADLAFKDPVLVAHAKIGILVASFLAAVTGIIWFKYFVKAPIPTSTTAN